MSINQNLFNAYKGGPLINIPDLQNGYIGNVEAGNNDFNVPDLDNTQNKENMRKLYIISKQIELYNAVEEGNIEKVQQILSTVKVDVNWVNPANTYKMSSLHKASKNGDILIVNALIAAGANVNIVDENGRTPLHEASQQGKELVVKSLIQSGANIDIKDNNGKTPLFLAAQSGFALVVKELCNAGADLNTVNNHGYTPIIIASRNGNVDVVKLLIKKRADISKVFVQGKSALDLAQTPEIRNLIEEYDTRNKIIETTQSMKELGVRNRILDPHSDEVQDLYQYARKPDEGGKKLNAYTKRRIPRNPKKTLRRYKKSRKLIKSRKTRNSRNSRNYRNYKK
jgi:ankyrin repeat protein